MSKALSVFYPWVLPWVPGVPDTLLDQMIRQSAIEFCNRTDLIQRVITANAASGVQDYTITPPTDMTLGRVLMVSWQGRLLELVSPEQVTSDLALRGTTIGAVSPVTGDPVWAYQKTPTDATISIYPIPDTTVTLGLTIKASFSPSVAAATLDDVLFDDYVDDIGMGAIAKLQAMPGQTFSSKSSVQSQIDYERAVERARHQKNMGSTAGALRVTPIRFP